MRADLARALDGELALADKLREKERAYSRPPAGGRGRPTVHWFDDEATDATVARDPRRGRDRPAVPDHRGPGARPALDVRSARVSSVGGSVVDAFYVTDARRRADRPAGAARTIEAELPRAL